MSAPVQAQVPDVDHGKDSCAILTHPTPSGHNW